MLKMTETQQREAVVAEAHTWIGTPYIIGQRSKQFGTDCAQFLAAVYVACGLIPEESIGIFSNDWFCNVTEDVYMLRILRHAHKVAEAVCFRSLVASRGDIVLTKAAHSKVYNHGAIVTVWPKIIHALYPYVQEIDATQSPLWVGQQIAIFSPWGNNAR